jgi:hypothetical protein
MDKQRYADGERHDMQGLDRERAKHHTQYQHTTKQKAKQL